MPYPLLLVFVLPLVISKRPMLETQRVTLHFWRGFTRPILSKVFHVSPAISFSASHSERQVRPQ
eukprot:scaffold52472_cov69-Phaeocystis_antarctica.AAC.5